MDNTYWQTQNNNEPLFADLHWSKPQFKDLSGKLAIIGGNSHGFSELSNCFVDANKAGIGYVKILAPDSLRKSLRPIFPEVEVAPSNRSGSFSHQALASWLDLADWSDGVIVCGDISHNSETMILLEQFINKCSKPISLINQSCDILLSSPLTILQANNLLIVPDLIQLQKFLIAIRYPSTIKSTSTINQVVDVLHSLTINYKFSLLFNFNQQIIIAQKGLISTTFINQDIKLNTALTYATVWRLQHPMLKSFQAMTTAIYELINN